MLIRATRGKIPNTVDILIFFFFPPANYTVSVKLGKGEIVGTEYPVLLFCVLRGAVSRVYIVE